jgi:hypothetical protein
MEEGDVSGGVEVVCFLEIASASRLLDLRSIPGYPHDGNGHGQRDRGCLLEDYLDKATGAQGR